MKNLLVATFFACSVLYFSGASIHGCPTTEAEESKAKALAAVLVRLCDDRCTKEKSSWLSEPLPNEENYKKFTSYDNCFRKCANETIAVMKTKDKAIAQQKQTLKEKAMNECMNQCFPDIFTAHFKMNEVEEHEQQVIGACNKTCGTWTETWSDDGGWVMFEMKKQTKGEQKEQAALNKKKEERRANAERHDQEFCSVTDLAHLLSSGESSEENRTLKNGGTRSYGKGIQHIAFYSLESETLFKEEN
uniref:Uncharacterized protein n=1 Tax=Trichuris muris TaxID=70415 RepID=A0A5S6Q7V6_TRIMR